MNIMPTFKLRKHQSNSCDDDILINKTDYPDLKLHDVVEVKPSKDNQPSIDGRRLYLQIRKWSEHQIQPPNIVSIKESVTTHLKQYQDVVIEKIDRETVVIDSIEICFSNAYLARSYMWGLRNYLNNRCVSTKQKLDYLNIRSQINEIWSQGAKVYSGFIDDDTKIVFRSASSLVYLFIQMSSEMWDYDINGDLYCEKAINGFLSDLFNTWRENYCSHDITIILFSRTFYEAKSINEFPKEMQHCLQVDSKNRFYEDYYRVAFQNDRFDLHDWNANLTKLKLLFNQYQKEVIERHQNKYDNVTIPRAYNSNASQGNFLEVLNMSLNVFEKHYFDRSFDRTGQLSVVVSPGVGVFEVDFEMTNLTKQRIIDNGIGSDLVCLGEQPLHTVPLLKLNAKSRLNQRQQSYHQGGDIGLETCDVYNIPHWINLSFYSTSDQMQHSNFIPRIKLPTIQQSKESFEELSSSSYIEEKSETNNTTASLSQQLPTQQTVNSDLEMNNSTNNECYANNGKLRYQITGTTSPPIHDDQERMAQPIPDILDYDDYDLQVFTPSSMLNYQSQASPAPRNVQRLNASIVPNYQSRNMPSMKYTISNIENNPPQNNTNNENNCNEKESSYSGRACKRTAFGEAHSYNSHQYSLDDARTTTTRVFNRQNSINFDDVDGADTSKNRMTTRNHFAELNNYHTHQLSSSTSNQIRFDNINFSHLSLSNNYRVTTRIESADDLLIHGYKSNSSRYNRSFTRPKALINPFDPSHMTIKLTPNRRRWTHVFPQGPSGTFMQEHIHQEASQQGKNLTSSAPYLANVMFNPNSAESFDDLGRKFSSARLNSQMSQTSLRPADTIPYLCMTDCGQPTNYSKEFQFNKPSVYSLQAAAAQAKSGVVSNETVRFAWCASGEQEWTPALTTGVDWKSLTMPACLPLTTDFFPSKTSLKNDYVICEYTLDASCIHPKYSLLEVYRELVCQRLQKGFQIILLSRENRSSTHQGNNLNQIEVSDYAAGNVASSAAAIKGTLPTSKTNLLSSGDYSAMHTTSKLTPQTSPRLQNQALNKGSRRTPSTASPHNKKDGSSISTNPGNSSEELAFVEKEKTDYFLSIGRNFHRLKLNGNSTISVTQYRPRHPYPTIKIDYWYRFQAPFHDTYEKSIVHFKSEQLENYNWNYLDNYISSRGEAFELRNDLRFWRFRIIVLPIQLRLRKLKHEDDDDNSADSNAESKSNDKLIDDKNYDSVSNKSNHSLLSRANTNTNAQFDNFHLEFSDDEKAALTDSFIKLLEIINKTRRSSTSRTTPSSSTSPIPTNSQVNLHSTQITPIQHRNSMLVTSPNQQSQYTSPSSKRASLTCPTTSVSLQPSIPALNLCSPNSLTFSVPSSFKSVDDTNRLVTIILNSTEQMNPVKTPLEFKSISMDIDSSLRDAKRSEWVHVQYHSHYEASQAFELVIKWMVASGVGIAEMVQGWSRRSGHSCVHLVPIPWEPFALPWSGKADPLRCPLFIRLYLDSVDVDSARSLFVDSAKVISFQDKILKRFGFVRFYDLVCAAADTNLSQQYVHLTGFAFVALVQTTTDNGDKSIISSDLMSTSSKVEFIWSWNYMLTKRWRSMSTLDEAAAVSLFKDFQRFCQNHNNRLTRFYVEVEATL